MTTTETRREAKAEDKATKAHAKAHTKALRPWYKKPLLIVPLVILGFLVVRTAVGGDSDGSPQGAPAGTDSPAGADAPGAGLFPGRPDSQKEDQERNLGEGVELSGFNSTVVSAGFQESISLIEEDGYVVVDVAIANQDDETQSYNVFDWKLQTPSGKVIDPTFSSIDGALDSGDLVAGGNVSGKLVFEAGDENGDFFIIYKPDAFDAARGIWKVSI